MRSSSGTGITCGTKVTVSWILYDSILGMKNFHTSDSVRMRVQYTIHHVPFCPHDARLPALTCAMSFHTWWCYWAAIIIKLTEQECPSREGRVGTGCAQKIQRKLHLRQKTVPLIRQEKSGLYWLKQS